MTAAEGSSFGRGRRCQYLWMSFDSYRSGDASRGGASTPVDFRSNLSFIADDLSVLDLHCYISFTRRQQCFPCL